ncbi:MAG: gfo/Idh/MocA family oxidoreductase [Planctomycetaceae bacterium]|nr:gfo/Idh/MocA family oxidoreductase [Planctomycetaceae bacterium]
MQNVVSVLKRLMLLVVCLPWLADFAGLHAQESNITKPPIRIGMIGLDTSHVPAFTKIFNDPKLFHDPNAPGDMANMRVVVGFPGGTDFPPSRDRVAGFTQQLRDMGVEIVDSIPALLEKCDVVLLESVDGRVHLEQALPVFQAGKPLFIDKPLAGSLADAIAIAELSERYQVPFFSCSSYRFTPAVIELLNNESIGTIQGVSTWGPCTYQDHTPDLYFYGVHGVEALYTLMGTGCETVTRIRTAETDLVSGTWDNGRVGTYRGIRNHASTFGATVFGTKSIMHSGTAGGYEPLCVEIAKFFRSGQAPVSAKETLEMFAFMEAADESNRRGGAPVGLEEVLQPARAAAKVRLETLLGPERKTP